MNARPARRRAVCALALVSACLSLLSTAAALAGTISGRVTDKDTGEGLPFANVGIQDTPWGAAADETGYYKIDPVPAGTYTLWVSFLGYEKGVSDPVELVDGGDATVDFALAATSAGTLDEVLVQTNKREVINLKDTQVKTGVTSEQIESLPVDEITDAIALKAGVVAKGDELYFRGGRSGEVAVLVDGIPIRNPASGSNASVGNFAVDDVEVILGGMDAKYGQVQSGVINYTTREGGEHAAGQVRYETDDFGAPDKTFNNYDRLQVGFGGPLPISNANYYVSAQGSWQNTFPATRERREHHRVLDFISVGDRGINDIRLQSKFTWKPGIPYKLSLEVLNNRTRQDTYIHNWSWDGYTQMFFDTVEAGQGGQETVLLRHGPWSPFKVDDSYVYYNAFEHTPDADRRFNQVKLNFTHTLGSGNTFYSVKASRQSFDDRASVGGKNPWEYEGDSVNDYYFDFLNETQSQFLVRFGDYPDWSVRKTKVYQSRVDMTHRWNNHTIEAGADFRYNDLFFHRVQEMYLFRDSGAGLIGRRDRYHYYQPEGAMYMQDRWEHEGMVLNLGMRYDAFSVGTQVDPAEVSKRVTQQISPRVGIAYPISDRDVFNFHYGRFYQFPDRQYLYNNRTVTDNRIRGNPNLSNETTVAYQAAIQHLFSESVKGQFSVYYKDIFGLLSVESVRAESSANLVDQYVNRDYASSRGFEMSLTRQFAGGFTGELAYTFGVATGVASDPNANNEQNFRYLPISEQPLDWDKRHTFDASFSVADPTGNWSLGVTWSFGTGFPYTPQARDTRDIEPEVVNSRRLPSDTNLDIQGERHYHVWGQPFKVFVQANNLLDTRNINTLEPNLFPLAPGLDGDEYIVYFSETGNAGGAYLGEDLDGDGGEDWVPVHDPRVFAEGRNIRLGVSLNF
jgi:outer membrane receptor for ferrienterochelin and colicin